MTPETRAKSLQTKREQAAQWAAQTVRIDNSWRIVRSDELNWEVQYKTKFKGFYGTLPAALRSLPDKMIGEEAGNSLATVQRSQKAILDRIENALNP